MKSGAFVYGSQQEYMIGAKRTAKAFRKALMSELHDNDPRYREILNKVYQNQIRRHVRRLSEGYVLLNSIGHAWNESIPPEKIDSFFLYHEALNLLHVSFKNLQSGAIMAAYAVQRQALEIASVAYRISIDTSSWKEFKNTENYSSTKCITVASRILPQVGRVYGRLSNQAVHITNKHIGKSITEEIAEGGVRMAIGYQLHPSNADAVSNAMIDLIEVDCLVEGLAEYSFFNYAVRKKYWSKSQNRDGEIYQWSPIGTAQEDFDFIEKERKKSEDPLHNLNRNVTEEERQAFEDAFPGFKLSDFDNQTKLESAISTSPNSRIVYSFLGFYYEKHGDLEKAISSYEKATHDGNLFGGLDRLSKLYAKTGQLDNCIETYKKLIHLEPDNGAAYNNFGKLLDELGFSTEALALLKRAVELDPSNEIRLYNYGNALLRNKQYQEAISIYEKVANLDRNDPKPWHSKGVALINLEKAEEAYRAFRKAIIIDPGYIASWLNLGCASQMRGHLRKARKIYLYCLQLVPEHYIASRNLSVVCADLGNTKEAKKYAKKVYKANPNDLVIKKLLKDLRQRSK